MLKTEVETSRTARRTVRQAALGKLTCVGALLLAGSAPAYAANPQLGNNSCYNSGTSRATSRCVTPNMGANYYVQQANRYFDSIDTSFPGGQGPDYNTRAARFEWYPWYEVTGYGGSDLEDTAWWLRNFYGSGQRANIVQRDCRYFSTQPFARCYVNIEYLNSSGQPCWIYEEFTFDRNGQVTFVEAWAALPGSYTANGGGTYLPMNNPEDDPWAKASNVRRLSTIIPGLGSPQNQPLDLDDPAWGPAGNADATVDKFHSQAQNWSLQEFYRVASSWFTGSRFSEGCNMVQNSPLDGTTPLNASSEANLFHSLSGHSGSLPFGYVNWWAGGTVTSQIDSGYEKILLLPSDSNNHETTNTIVIESDRPINECNWYRDGGYLIGPCEGFARLWHPWGGFAYQKGVAPEPYNGKYYYRIHMYGANMRYIFGFLGGPNPSVGPITVKFHAWYDH